MSIEVLLKQSAEGFGDDRAKAKPCELIYEPSDPKYDESIRSFQGCPTLAVSRGGRIFIGWYSGGTCEPHMDNYNILTFSDDGGKTFGKPYIVIPSDKERCVHALDIQLWTAPNGALWMFWVQNNTIPEGDKKIKNFF